MMRQHWRVGFFDIRVMDRREGGETGNDSCLMAAFRREMQGYTWICREKRNPAREPVGFNGLFESD